MYGDHCDYFWRDKGGFDWTQWVVFTQNASNGNNRCGTGANGVKQLGGNSADQTAEGGGPLLGSMNNGLATHLLRLAEVYLIYAEAVIGNAGSTTDPNALDAYNKVLLRAIPGETPKTSITWDDVWKQRRLELAGEGDSWCDYVRRSYYDPDGAINELINQRRSTYSGLWDLYTSGSFDPNTTYYDKTPPVPNPGKMYDPQLKTFKFPFPDTDVTSNPRLMEDPVDQDISQYKY